MAEYSYPYQTGTGAAVDENAWRGMVRQFLASGVIGSGNRDTSDPSLKPTLGTGGAGPTFQLAAGEAFNYGIKYTNDATLTRTASNNTNTAARIDRLALKLDTAAKTCTVVPVQGTPAGTPISPTLTDTDTVKWIPIARATCPGSASAQNYTNLVDERAFVAARDYVGPATATVANPQPGDTWLQPDTRERLLWLGGKWVGTRQKTYTGTPLGTTGNHQPLANDIGTYARIDIPALPYDYQIQFTAHLNMVNLGAGNFITGSIRQDNHITGTICAIATAPSVGGLDADFSLPQTKPVTITDRVAHTFWFNIISNVNGSYWSWTAPTLNWFTATVTPIW